MSLSAVKTMCCSEDIKATSVTGLAYFEYFYNGSVLSYFSIWYYQLHSNYQIHAGNLYSVVL